MDRSWGRGLRLRILGRWAVGGRVFLVVVGHGADCGLEEGDVRGVKVLMGERIYDRALEANARGFLDDSKKEEAGNVYLQTVDKMFRRLRGTRELESSSEGSIV